MRAIYTPRGRAYEYSPLAVNLYSGCVHGCFYCYAPACLRRSRAAFHGNVDPRPGVLADLERDLWDRLRHGAITDQKVLLCFTSDPYQPNTRSITRDALEMMRAVNQPFQVLTKGGLRAAADFDLYGPSDAFATTLTFEDRHLSRQWEPLAADPSERIAAIRQAKAAGIKTWVSFEPVLDEAQVFYLLSITATWVDLYKVGKCSGSYSTVTDWAAFGHRIEGALKAAGKAYYLKEDLRKEMSKNP
jgi:DNA repair photolyase